MLEIRTVSPLVMSLSVFIVEAYPDLLMLVVSQHEVLHERLLVRIVNVHKMAAAFNSNKQYIHIYRTNYM